MSIKIKNKEYDLDTLFLNVFAIASVIIILDSLYLFIMGILTFNIWYFIYGLNLTLFILTIFYFFR